MGPGPATKGARARAHVFCPMDPVLCPMSYVLCPMSNVLCPMSCVLCPMAYGFCNLPYTYGGKALLREMHTHLQIPYVVLEFGSQEWSEKVGVEMLPFCWFRLVCNSHTS